MVLTLIGGLMDLSPSHKHLEEETLKERMKMEEVREMGAPSSYLTGLLHIPSFAPGYKRAKPFSPRA
jgi:hypothetical protein